MVRISALRLVPSFIFLWVTNMLIYVHIIETVEAYTNFTMVGPGYLQDYCQTKPGLLSQGSFINVVVICDVLFMFLMVWTSINMANLLCRHQRRAQHLHSPSLSSQPSPEHRATHTILLLVCCFVFFYCLNNLMTLYLYYRNEENLRLQTITEIISSCYPTLCPFALVKNNKIISQYISSLLR